MSDTLVKLVPSKTVVKPGEQFTVDVVVEPATGIRVAGMQADIKFDPQALQVDEMIEGDFLKQGGNTFFGMMGEAGGIHNETGLVDNIVGAITGPGLVSQSGTFCTLTCTALKAGSTSAFALEDVLVGGWDGVTAINLPFELVIVNQVAVMSLADLNYDGKVDLADMAIMAGFIGSGNTGADLNKDGKVDILDLITVARQCVV